MHASYNTIQPALRSRRLDQTLPLLLGLVRLRVAARRVGFEILVDVRVGQPSHVLPKIPSKIAKFHLQIVENRLEFQSKNLPPLDPTGPSTAR